MNINQELSITEELFIRSSEEGGDWLRVLQCWCTDQKNQNMATNYNSDAIENLFERFYLIHKKIHHRIILIQLGMMDDPKSTEELRSISFLGNQFLEEQNKLIHMILAMKSKSFLGVMSAAWNAQKYMRFVNQSIDNIFSNWALNDRGGLVYNPSNPK